MTPRVWLNSQVQMVLLTEVRGAGEEQMGGRAD